jgi:hypothetical protein
MFGTTRRLAVIIGICLLAVSAAPVLAAAPDNDDIGSPIVVSAIPYTNTQDTTEATTGPTDPDCDGTGPTVWYELTPTEDQRLEANTFGSDYDTTLYVGRPDGAGGIDLIDCNDDAGGDVQSRLRFDARQGETYLLMVGAFGGGTGGNLVFNVDIAPPVVPVELTLSIDTAGRFDRQGVATISGVVSCSGAEYVELYAELRQQVGRFSIIGYSFDFVECSAEGATWQMQIRGITGKYAGGPATAFAFAEACGIDDCVFESVEASVRLRK